MPDSSIERPVAIVTGAARGIGAATARELAACGHRLVLVDVLEAELTALTAELVAAGTEVLPMAGDLADIEFCRSIVAQTFARFGRLDLLVNNAAWRKVESLRETSLADWDRTLRICLTAPAFLARFAAEVMQPQRRGVIVNITSIRTRYNDGTAAAYVAAKGGLEALTRELAALYGPHGLRVVSLAPGATRRWPVSARRRKLPAQFVGSPATLPRSSAARRLWPMAACRTIIMASLSNDG
jgi:NAD(P)-dependent dehydrogenase (short-subunit alcohol dehydrogenase family)